MPSKKKQATTKSQKSDPKPKTKVVFLLDSSGSMSSIQRPTVDAFNRVLETIKAAAAEQDASVSLYTFGERSEPVSRKLYNQPLADLRPLNYSDYKPQDMTPLFDAVGTAIMDHLALPADKDTSFIVTIITDGHENMSKKWDARTIRDLIARVQSTDKWTVTYLVPPGERQRLVNSVGVHEGNVQEWEASARGVAAVGSTLSAGYSNYFQDRSRGITSTRGFFTTDLSKVSLSDVKQRLTDLSSNIAVLSVTAEQDIRDFVEAHGYYPYIKGRAYYQLTKDEAAVQDYKQILLREKNGRAIYGGSEAREILGLPDSGTVKVRPGNHANWDVFIQSTSVNRRLVRGTKLLLVKS